MAKWRPYIQSSDPFGLLYDHCKELVGWKKGESTKKLTKLYFGRDDDPYLRKIMRSKKLGRVKFWILDRDKRIFGPVHMGGEWRFCVAERRWEAEFIARWRKDLCEGTFEFLSGNDERIKTWTKFLGQPPKNLVSRGSNIRRLLK